MITMMTMTMTATMMMSMTMTLKDSCFFYRTQVSLSTAESLLHPGLWTGAFSLGHPSAPPGTQSHLTKPCKGHLPAPFSTAPVSHYGDPTGTSLSSDPAGTSSHRWSAMRCMTSLTVQIEPSLVRAVGKRQACSASNRCGASHTHQHGVQYHT